MSPFREYYMNTVIPTMEREFGYRSALAVPRLVKIVVSAGIGKLTREGKSYEWLVNDLARITGQKPVVNRARKAIANFKIRRGMPIGLSVTLRGRRMEAFLERFTKAALPRVRDFRGIAEAALNGGALTVGLKEHIIFPEVTFESTDKVHGFEVTMVTTAKKKEETKALLSLLGVPFQRKQS
ncbi:MAG: 50S ribosomal protein L5 [Parcubacteria group bacterium]|nr:50S ribosomal protein L5 [Parcubacteria group bacterium]